MNVDAHLLMTWARDLALAYAGGLVLGAPLAVLGVSVTGIERVSTICLLLAMSGLFVALRRRSLRESNGPTRGDGASPPLAESSVASRRVA